MARDTCSATSEPSNSPWGRRRRDGDAGIAVVQRMVELRPT